MEQDHPTFTDPLAGDQGRAVGQRRPGFLGQLQRGLGQNLAPNHDIARHGEAMERRAGGKGGQGDRRVPGQSTAKHAIATAQDDGQGTFRICGQARPGKADEQAAGLDPIIQQRDVGEGCVIGHRQDGELALQQLLQGSRPQLGEGAERAFQVVAAGQERLRL